MPFLNILTEKCKSESGYGWTGRILEKLMGNLASTFVLEGRLVNKDEWDSDGKSGMNMMVYVTITDIWWL